MLSVKCSRILQVFLFVPKTYFFSPLTKNSFSSNYLISVGTENLETVEM